MDFNDYQKKAITTAVYPGQGKVGGILYTALGLAGEAGETCNKVKRILRDDNRVLTDSRRTEIIKELGDCLWYIAMCSTEIKVNMSDIATLNLAKLAERKATGTIKGQGDNR